MASVIKNLSGTVDSNNRVFTTPSAYVTGSLRGIIEGVVYKIDHASWGYDELSSTSIRFKVAPTTGFSVQAFYVESESTGSPFDPNGAFP